MSKLDPRLNSTYVVTKSSNSIIPAFYWFALLFSFPKKCSTGNMDHSVNTLNVTITKHFKNELSEVNE